jgi:hypothetical protein
LVRGRLFGYGEQFDCSKPESKNWVALYDPATNTERVVFDRAVPFDDGAWEVCVFTDMQLSYDGSVLYLVSPVYATSGSLAIINLANGSIGYVPGVNMVFVIETGPHRDELIYQRRIWQKRFQTNTSLLEEMTQFPCSEPTCAKSAGPSPSTAGNSPSALWCSTLGRSHPGS